MSKCWYCNEELTTANYCDEHIGICTKCYGSMFKVSNEFVKGLTDKIADLEAKLAKNKKWLASNEGFLENQKLKQQLTEKEEIIDWQNEIVDGVKQEEELLAQKLKSLGVDCIEDLGKEHNQDKILFAIEKLEKVKAVLNELFENEHGCYVIIDTLDNQIEELKKEMK